MHIDELLKKAELCVSKSRYMQVPEHWSHGDSVFSGLTAALLFHVTSPLSAVGRPLYSVKTHFIGTLLIDRPFTFEVELLREDNNHSKVTGRIIQNDEVVVVQHSCFGRDTSYQDSIRNIEPTQNDRYAPDLPFADTLPSLRDATTNTLIKTFPGYTKQVDFAVAKLPRFCNKKNALHHNGWMKLKASPVRTTGAHLICLIDAWPAFLCGEMNAQSSGSIVMWNLEFPHSNHEDLGTEWFAYQSNIRKIAGGYAHVEANVWGKNKQLVAISTQSVDLAC